MTIKDAIRFSLSSNRWVTMKYLEDLGDADLLVHPVPGANHIAYQLGHVIIGEVNVFLSKVPGAVLPALPEGFVQQHDKARAHDPEARFRTKAEYLELLQATRNDTLAALDQFPEERLGEDPGMGWGDMVPSFAALFLFIANHELMHTGQFSVVRRLLGKKVAF